MVEQATPQMQHVSSNRRFFSLSISGGYKNTVDNRFYCVVCGRNYLRKANLLRHVRHECIGIPPQFQCHYCPVKYRRKEDLVRHIRTKHEAIQIETKLEPTLMDDYKMVSLIKLERQ